MSSGSILKSNDENHLSAKNRQSLIGERYRGDSIPIGRLFLAKHSPFPCVMKTINIDENQFFHIPKIIDYFILKFSHNPKCDIIQKKTSRQTKQAEIIARLCDLNNGIMVFMRSISYKSSMETSASCIPDFGDDYYMVSKHMKICYLAEMDSVVLEMIDDILKLTITQRKSSSIHFISKRGCTGYYLRDIKIRDPVIHDLALHYGSDFISFHTKILKRLMDEAGRGIVLLHGVPGSGKTHYIRYLIANVKDKKFIYVPTDLARDLANPSFLTFLLTVPNSILIIEDAENIVRDRNDDKYHANQAVANLLNISDGLLSDALSIQIIATFNCNLRSIDPALLRAGRLLGSHEFGPLSVEEAKLLSEKLGFDDKQITKPMTLAEIYNTDGDQ